jgi:cell division protein ZapE
MLINYLNHKITLDSEQLLIYKKLSKFSAILAKNSASNSWLNLFVSKRSKIANDHRSLYIYGDVGRGKTMLMKNFYDSQKISKKVYFHFNDFMKKIHENLGDLRREKNKYPDELIEVAKRMVKDNKLLCLDEFQAIDIADAMILARIFTFLFEQPILIIFTSNCHPLELYQSGLAKELFLEFVNNILLKKCEVVSLNGLFDYRGLVTDKDFKAEKKYIENLDQIYLLDNQKNSDKIKKIIKTVTDNQPLKPRQIEVWQRKIIISKTYRNIAIIDFGDLILANFGASDYHEICQNFDLVFLLKIPDFKKENCDDLRRFILLIDEIYESKTALIMLAEVEINYLGAEILKENNYKSGSFKKSNIKAFARTISRLKEICSSRYFWESKLFKQIQDV